MPWFNHGPRVGDLHLVLVPKGTQPVHQSGIHPGSTLAAGGAYGGTVAAAAVSNPDANAAAAAAAAAAPLPSPDDVLCAWGSLVESCQICFRPWCGDTNVRSRSCFF